MKRTSVPLVFSEAARWLRSEGARFYVLAVQARWGGWGSNPRPADYESAALTG